MEDRGACDKMLHALLTDILFGTVDSESIRDRRVIEAASRGLLHSVAVASRLAGSTGKLAFVHVRSPSTLRGVLVVAAPPGLANGSNIGVCALDILFPVACNSPSVSAFWPGDEREVRVFLVDDKALGERAKELGRALKGEPP